VIKDKTGIIINPGDVNAIADAVKRFYKENLETKFSDNIKEEKKKYSWEVFTDNIMYLAKEK
jgi:glycosyltransferase involved in cell wall biosynthesis